MNWGSYDLDFLMGVCNWELKPELALARTWRVPARSIPNVAEGSDAEDGFHHAHTVSQCQRHNTFFPGWHLNNDVPLVLVKFLETDVCSRHHLNNRNAVAAVDRYPEPTAVIDGGEDVAEAGLEPPVEPVVAVVVEDGEVQLTTRESVSSCKLFIAVSGPTSLMMVSSCSLVNAASPGL